MTVALAACLFFLSPIPSRALALSDVESSDAQTIALAASDGALPASVDDGTDGVLTDCLGDQLVGEDAVTAPTVSDDVTLSREDGGLCPSPDSSPDEATVRTVEDAGAYDACDPGAYELRSEAESTPLEGAASSGQSSAVIPDDVSAEDAPEEQVVEDGLYELVSEIMDSLRVDASDTTSSGGGTTKTKTANDTPSQRWHIVSVGDGYYSLQNVATGNYLQAPARVVGNSAALSLAAADASEAQQWGIIADSMRAGCYILKPRAYADMALDIAGASQRDGACVQLYLSNGTAAQSFRLLPIVRQLDDGFYVITNGGSGLAMDVKAASLANSANVQQWTANGTMAQTFKVTYDEATGYYGIVSVQSGKALDVAGGRSANGTNVQMYAYNGSRAQSWCIRKLDDGSFGMFSSIDGRALDVRAGSTLKGANVQTYQSNGTSAQKWCFTPKSDWLPAGAYEIVTDTNSCNVVTMGKSIDSGALGVTAARNSLDMSSIWQLVWMDDGYVRLVNLGSGYVLSAGGTGAIKGIQVVQKKWADTDAQKWRPLFVTGGIMLQSRVAEEMVLDISGASKRVGAAVQTWASNGTAAQCLHLVAATAYKTNTPYTIRSIATRQGVIDIRGASALDGAVAQLYQSNSTTAQTFVFINAGDGFVRIRNVNSEKYLALSNTGASIIQVSSATGNNTKWQVRFDEELNALQIVSFRDSQSVMAASGISAALKRAKASQENPSAGFVLCVDGDVSVNASTGRAARNTRVNVAGRGWCWADATCKLHGKVVLNVPYVNQYDYGARMGCEGAALYMCLRYAGYCSHVSYTQFLNAAVYSSNGNPNLGFVGSPWKATGNIDGVLPAGAVRWVNKYATGHNVSGIGATGLLNSLYKSVPVAVWVTPSFRASGATTVYGTTVPSSWHCVTLIGYDPSNNNLVVADPASDAHTYQVSWNTFFSRWNMGQNAVTVS